MLSLEQRVGDGGETCHESDGPEDVHALAAMRQILCIHKYCPGALRIIISSAGTPATRQSATNGRQNETPAKAASTRGCNGATAAA